MANHPSRRVKRVMAQGDLKLHLGCLDQPIDGWINTDITMHIRVARIPFAATALKRAGRISPERFEQHKRGVFKKVDYLDVSKRFPFDDDSVSAVYSTHMLEHLPLDIAANFVQESFRVLKPGGVFRVGVPDLDLAIGTYDPSDPNPFVMKVFEAQQSMDKDRHSWMYNEVSLAAFLRANGFFEPRRRGFQEGDCPDLKLLDNRPDETLFMEAKK